MAGLNLLAIDQPDVGREEPDVEIFPGFAGPVEEGELRVAGTGQNPNEGG
jgi:hypothetical protein